VLRTLLTGLPVLFACMLLQAVFVTLSLRFYVSHRDLMRRQSHLSEVTLLSSVMLLTLVGNFIQMAVWALLFLLLGEFSDFQMALYHSGVNFTTLGYGDIVMSEHWRLLGPLEAANGILMFGVSTAVMTAAVLDVIKFNSADKGQPRP
jgi:hypothetical protein